MSTSEPSDGLAKANDRIRETAKWLIASFAAIGAVLIAGSQLSSIGRLKLSDPRDALGSVSNARIWIALLGATLALAAVAWTIWSASGILLPRAWTLDALDWEERTRGRRSPLVKFFQATPDLLRGHPNLHAVKEAKDAAEEAYDAAQAAFRAAADQDAAARRQARDYAYDDLARLEAFAADLSAIANHVSLADDFRRKSRLTILLAAFVAAAGVVAFAWAANPPKPPAATPASLRGANLEGAILSGANLVNADLSGAVLTDTVLRGAQLRGAKLDKVTWDNTTCPDGTNSDDAARSCVGHLAPPP